MGIKKTLLTKKISCAQFFRYYTIGDTGLQKHLLWKYLKIIKTKERLSVFCTINVNYRRARRQCKSLRSDIGEVLSVALAQTKAFKGTPTTTVHTLWKCLKLVISVVSPAPCLRSAVWPSAAPATWWASALRRAPMPRAALPEGGGELERNKRAASRKHSFDLGECESRNRALKTSGRARNPQKACHFSWSCFPHFFTLFPNILQNIVVPLRP